MGKPTTRALARQEMRRIRDGLTRVAGHVLTLQGYLGGQVSDEVDTALVLLEEQLKALDDLNHALYRSI